MPIKDEVLKILRAEAGKCRIPNENSLVEKDECMLSFDSPFSPQGLYTNLNSWKSYGRDYVEVDSKNTGQKLYLYQKKYNVKKPKKEESELEKEKQSNENPTKLAIGVEGGFTGFESDTEIKEENMLCVLPDFTLIDLSEQDIPMMISNCINSIITCKGIGAHEEFKSWSGDDDAKPSKHEDNLFQLNDMTCRPSPNPDDWKCKSCGQSDKNLWFNLSDGYIGCGRKQWDGSGGCGAAAEHYKETREINLTLNDDDPRKGKIYPLAVKLGTITPQGGDVWSYDEDKMVTDKNLGSHLAHWGIDIMKQKKTDLSVMEQEIEMNKDFIFGAIVESGKKLEHVCGPNLIGLVNLGNSCYMNSVLQSILTIPQVQEKYFKDADNILSKAPRDNTANDFVTQFTKLAVGCGSDRYIKQRDESLKQNLDKGKQVYGEDYVPRGKDKEEKKDEEGTSCVSVKPRMLKRLIGSGHEEFGTNRQQDAVEYFRHLLEFINRQERTSKLLNKDIPGVKQLFKLRIEERLECQQSNKVRYSIAEDVVLRVDVDKELAYNKEAAAKYEKENPPLKLKKKGDDASNTDNTNNTNNTTNENTEKKKSDEEIKQELMKKDKEKVRYKMKLEALLSKYLGDQMITDWMSPATNKKGLVKKNVKLASFPDYLAIQIQRYFINESWQPEKYDYIVEVPEELNLQFMRGKGKQDNEEELPKGGGGGGGGSGNVNKPPKLEPDATIVSNLLMLGLAQTENAAKRAAIAVQNANVDMAAVWLLDHGHLTNINDPIEDDEDNSSGGGGGGGGGDESGFKADQAKVNELNMLTTFKKEYCEIALEQTNNDAARAAEWLYSRMDNLEQECAKIKSEKDEKQKEAKNYTDGKGEYELMAIVSHLGNATSHGHYVAHIKKKDNIWYFFNDSKVAVSQATPFDLGYLYIFKRKN